MRCRGCIFIAVKRIISLLIPVVLLAAACETDAELINSPQPRDIYILEEKGVYYPMKLDSVANDVIYMVNSKFVFTDAIPQPGDLPDNDFDYAFHLIYEREELKRLYDDGKIIEVYRE